ncbi:MAG: filamentous hemagglutinin N-terminal domain-containing protein [Burkholderiales bacterium]
MTTHRVLAALLLAVPLACAANPNGPQVAAGAASFHSAPSALTVTNAPGTIINWQGFSIGAGELTRFQQQSAASAVLNRVTGADPSSILGTLSSNGRVFLVNPHGIVFGAGSRVDTAGFIASTLNISDADFLAGRLRFEGGGHGILRNEGAIRASGDIFLVGPQIENAGAIQSDAGSVMLAAGRSVTITSPDAHGVQFALQAPEDRAVNLGSISAANAASMFAGTLKHSGDIRAVNASTDAAGRVILAAQTDAIVEGGATIRADSVAGKGGHVQVTGERVGLFDQASVSARGGAGGGSILVGGDYQGRNPEVPNAARSYVGKDVMLDADASAAGDGGKVVVWADEVTRYYGSASVRGGAQGGNGGLVEVSGKQALEFRGRAALEAPQGVAGTLLLDPLNITVQAGAGTLDGHLTPPADPTLAFGDASGVTGTLDAAELAAFTSGTVELQADNNITVNAAVTMASGVNLKLAAINNVNVNANITTSGGGNLRLEADTDASGAGVITLGSVTINAPLIAGDTGKEFSGKVNVTGNVSFAQDAEAFGQITLGGSNLNIASGKTLTLKGGMSWAGTGTISGPGTLSLPSGQTLALTTTGSHALSGVTLNNAGTITSNIGGAAHHLLLNDSSVLNNSGTYQFNSGDNIGANSGSGTFNNTGTLRVSGAVTGTVTGSVAFNNNGGTLNSDTGTLNIGVGGSHTGTTTISGTAVNFTGGTRTFNDSASVSGQLNIANATASFGTVTTSGLVNYTGGGFNITSGDTLTLNGGMTWATTNSINGPGTISLPSGQTLALTTTGSHAFSGVTVNNAGTITSSIGGPSHHLLLNDSSVLNNSGTYQFNSSDGINANSGSGTFNNTGTLRVSGAVTGTVTGSVAFNNNGGAFNSDTGTLNIGVGGSHTGTTTISGTGVNFTGGTRTFNDGASISGQLNVAGATASFGTVTTSGLVNYTGGGFNITSGDTLTLNGGMTWATTNSINGPGTISLPSGQTLALTTTGSHAFSGVTVNNAGTITSSIGGPSHHLLLNDSSVLNNSGTYQFNSSDGINANSGSGTFNNTGTLRVSGAVTGTVTGSVAFNNNGGTLNSDTGTLNIGVGGSHSNAMTVTNGNVRFTGGTHVFSGASFAGTGAINVQGATFQFGNTSWNRSLAFSSGTVTSQAGTTTSVPSGASIAINHAVGGSGTISNAGTVDLSGGSIAGSFTNMGGTLNLASGNGTISTGLTSSSGTISPSSGRTLNVAGSGLAWQGGTLAGAGTYNLTGGLTVSGSGTRVLNGPTFTVNNFNLPGGSLDVQAGTLNLNGTTTIASGSTLMFSGGTLSLGGALNNNGTFDVNTGTFNLGNGGTSTGTFDAASGTTINFSGGTHDLGDGSKLAGAGTIGYTGGTLNINGSGSGTTIASGATLNANGRTFGGTGKIVNEGTFNLATSTVSGALDNKGTLNSAGASTVNGALDLTSGTLDLAAGGTLTKNGAAATWTGGAIAGTGSYTGGLAFSGSGARTLDGPSFSLGATTLPGGSLKVQGGTLGFSGTATVASGATLEAAGGTITSTADIDVSGTLRMSGGALTATSIDVLSGGTLSGTGTVDANVANAGTVAVGASAGTLTVDGDYTQAAAGVLNMELGGTAQGTSYDLLKITGNASLGGTLKLGLIDGFTGAAGNVFDLLTYASRSGDFSTFTLPSGYTFSSAPNATFYRMTLDSVSGSLSSSTQALTSSITASLALSIRQLNDAFLAGVEANDGALDEENLLSSGLSCR